MALDVERGLISKILQLHDMSGIEDNNITIQYFTGNNRNAMQYIMDCVKSTGEVPTVRAFKAAFPKYKLETYEDESGDTIVGNEENIKYWCNEVRKKARHNSMVNCVEEVAGMLQDFNSEEAYAHIKKTISYIDTEITESTDIDITKNTEKRKQEYLERKKNQGIRGITTGFKLFDYMTAGFEKQTLTTVIANTGIGKTWFDVLLGARFQLANYRVLQGVTEMSEDIMRDRYEAVLFAMCYGEINYEDFKRGRLDYETEQLYFQFLDEDLPNFEPLQVVTATDVIKLSSDIEKYKPDVVLIDSAYLMEDARGAKDDWLRIAHITRDLKKLSKSLDIPIIINSQADKNTSKKTGPELGSIMYTQAIGQDSDRIIALFRDEMMINDQEMCVKFLKEREGRLGRIMFNWDFNNMVFDEIYSDDYNKKENENSSEENIIEDYD